MPANKTQKNGKPQKVKFHYIKTLDYRTFNVDGVYGGLTPQGKLFMALFSERNPLPQEEEYSIIDGKLGARIRMKGKEGVIREVGAGLSMDYNTMVVVRTWLDTKIRAYEKAKFPPKDERSK